MKANLCSKQKDLGALFIFFSFVSLFSTLLFLYLSHGDLFSKIFFSDSLDTGMDFFHSIEYVRGRVPYEKYGTLYPPLANLFFYMIFLLVPYWQHDQWEDTFEAGISARGTYIDLRVWQPTLFLFIMFVLISTLLLFLLIQKILSYHKRKNLLTICFIMSYGILWAFERGNIIIIAFICCLFFVAYKDSENRILSEIALFMLAVSAGLKLYPAIFGLLLLYDRNYKKAVRTILYGIALFILPFLFFREKLSGLPILIRVVLNFGKASNTSVNAFTVDNILKIIGSNFDLYFDEKVMLYALLCIKFLVLFLVFASGFFVHKKWQKILVCCLIFSFIQAAKGYNVIFFIIALLYMLIEEKDISIQNIVPFIALVFTQLLLPIYDNDDFLISLVQGRFQICVYVLCLYLIYIASKNIKKKY